jgi:hypothetical protein
VPAPKSSTGRRTALKIPRLSPWVAAVLGLVALAEAGVIAVLVMRQPAPAAEVQSGSSAVSTPGVRTPIPDGERIEPPVPAPTARRAASVNTTSAASQDPLAANNQRSGGVRLQTPIELKVLQGDRVLGSSEDGPIIMRAGTYQLDLINPALGLSMRQPVTFRAGQLTTLTVTLPPGRVSVNAEPWAEVSIDGRLYGETPLANLQVPIGEHEIVFRHPELGERRQTVTVRADRQTRVSVSFEK